MSHLSLFVSIEMFLSLLSWGSFQACHSRVWCVTRTLCHEYLSGPSGLGLHPRFICLSLCSSSSSWKECACVCKGRRALDPGVHSCYFCSSSLCGLTEKKLQPARWHTEAALCWRWRKPQTLLKCIGLEHSAALFAFFLFLAFAEQIL